MLYVLTKIFEKQPPPSSADSIAELYEKHLTFTMLESLGSMVERKAIPSPARFLEFVYQELTGGKTIRVLSFEEGNSLRCRLREVSLHSEEPTDRYRALSYVWGPAEPRRTIICNGVSIPVTQNLYGALVELRTLGTAANWWIDAICISQGNVEEKSQQVALCVRFTKVQNSP
jgi:hypothetical protein